ncbi:hypothetical protein [Pseudomonas sp. PLMAX]|uniref:hypothetical protein n=1 Tax=Pseudomonas sp. PLMAX TaxID=2201998 RepID=UPI0038B9CC0C
MGGKWFRHIQVVALILCLFVLGMLAVTAASGNWQDTLVNPLFFAGAAAVILTVNLYISFKEQKSVH